MSSAAVAPSAPAKAQTIQPNQTLYIWNLEDKIAKQELRRALYGLFSTQGHILDVVALKTMKMRGQAHIVFRNIQTSTLAMRNLQGMELFGKKMQIAYGRGKSNMISILDGTAKMPEIKPETGTSTELQKSIFNAPPPSKSVAPAAANGSVESPDVAMEEGPEASAKAPQGVKRRRDDDDVENEPDAPMEVEDEDEDDAAMDESD